MKSFPNPTATNQPRRLGAARGGRQVAVGALVALALTAAACTDDAPSTGTDAALTSAGSATTPSTTPATTPATTALSTTTTATTATTDPTDHPSTTDGPSSTATETGPEDSAAPGSWIQHPSGDDCRCADGSEHAIHTLAGDRTKVLLYFQGGGACVDSNTCDPASGTYKTGTWPGDHPGEGASGVFALNEPRNPFREWTWVYVPYCSADFFLGDAVTTYGDGRSIEHRGANTVERAVDLVAERYGDLETLVVSGTSAGAVPTPLAAGLASDALPSADIAVLADGAGGYPSDPELNAYLAEVWGTDGSMPPWPELAATRPIDWGIPDLFTFAGLHDPSIRMARFDDSRDSVQVYFASLLVGAARASGAGIEPFDGDLPAHLARNEQRVEDAGVRLDAFLTPFDAHTVLDAPRLYDVEVDGLALVDWIAQLANGTAPGDVG